MAVHARIGLMQRVTKHARRWQCRLLLGLALLAPATHAADGYALAAGRASGVRALQVSVQWNWGDNRASRWLAEYLGARAYWDLALNGWHAVSDGRGHRNMAGAGFTPMFRWQHALSGWTPYAEAGTGVHYWSGRSIQPDHRFGTRFEFGTTLGAGVRFGGRGAYDLSLRFEHISNASIAQPNPGINFTYLRLARHF